MQMKMPWVVVQRLPGNKVVSVWPEDAAMAKPVLMPAKYSTPTRPVEAPPAAPFSDRFREDLPVQALDPFVSLVDLKQKLVARETSSYEVTRFFLDRIKHYDGALASFVHVFYEEALAAAKRHDALMAAGALLAGLGRRLDLAVELQALGGILEVFGGSCFTG